MLLLTTSRASSSVSAILTLRRSGRWRTTASATFVLSILASIGGPSSHPARSLSPRAPCGQAPSAPPSNHETERVLPAPYNCPVVGAAGASRGRHRAFARRSGGNRGDV